MVNDSLQRTYLWRRAADLEHKAAAMRAQGIVRLLLAAGDLVMLASLVGDSTDTLPSRGYLCEHMPLENSVDFTRPTP
jgi:hypothetical protein